jgi:hypothetical protein
MKHMTGMHFSGQHFIVSSYEDECQTGLWLYSNFIVNMSASNHLVMFVNKWTDVTDMWLGNFDETC